MEHQHNVTNKQSTKRWQFPCCSSSCSFSSWCVRQSPHASWTCVVSYLVLLFFLFRALGANTPSKPSAIPCVTYIRLCNQPLPTFCTMSNKTWEWGYTYLSLWVYHNYGCARTRDKSNIGVSLIDCKQFDGYVFGVAIITGPYNTS